MYHTFCFLIPKIILKNPHKNLGLFTNTTFINCLLINSVFTTWDTQYNNPYCKDGNKKFRWTKTTDKQPESKSQGSYAFTFIAGSSHFCHLFKTVLQYYYIKKVTKGYINYFFLEFHGFKSFILSNSSFQLSFIKSPSFQRFSQFSQATLHFLIYGIFF